MGEQSRNKLAARLKAARVLTGKTQEQFGRLLLCSRDQVAYWEQTGRLDAMMLPPIADVSGLSCEWILGREPAVTNSN